MEKLKEKWWKDDEMRAKCDKSEDQSNGISIDNIGGVFIVIFVGIGMACITLIFEYWWYKHRKTPKIIDVSEAPKPIGNQQKLNIQLMAGSGQLLSGANTRGDDFHIKQRVPHYAPYTHNTRSKY